MKRGLFLFIVLLFAANTFAQGYCYLQVITPNGGEVLVSRDTTVISWEGIEAIDTVKLEYSTDNGVSWVLITDSGTANRYVWHVPFEHSRDCLVRTTKFSYSQKIDWAKQGGARISANAFDVTSDDTGNVYVTGTFFDTLNIGGNVLTAYPNDVFIAKYGPDGSIRWVKRAGGAYLDYGYGIAVDRSGNIYVTGYFSQQADFGGIILSSPGGGSDMFLAKYTANGDIEWAKRAGSNQFDFGHDLAIDYIGNVFLTGVFQDSIRFDSVLLNSVSPRNDIFLVKYRSDGTVEWATCAGGDGWDGAADVAVDNLGWCYLTGGFQDTANFSGNKIFSKGGFDIFIAKYSPSGNIDWVERAGGIGDDRGSGIVADGSDNLYITGSFEDTADFNSSYVISKGFHDIFLAKYDSQGNFEWVKRAGGTRVLDFGYGISIDKLSNVYITGEFQDTADFGDYHLDVGNSTGKLFIAKYCSNGDIVWAKTTDGSGGSVGHGLKITPSNGIVTVGTFASSTIFGKVELSCTDNDYFVWKTEQNDSQVDISDSKFTIMLPEEGVYIPDDSAAPGEHKGIPILLGGSVTKNYSKLGAVKFKAEVEFNSSLLAPDGVVLPSVIDKGRRTLTVETSWDGSSDTLTTIPFIAALGDAETTTMNIPKFEWLDGFGAPLTLDVETKSGTFKINDICYEGGARLIITNGQFSLSEPIPNPSSNFTTIRYNLLEEGYTELVITDVIGREVRTLFSGEAKPGSYSVRVNTDQLATGKYFYTLRTPTLHAMKMMLVEH